MSVEMPSGVMVADMMEGMRFAMGAVMATRRDALEKDRRHPLDPRLLF